MLGKIAIIVLCMLVVVWAVMDFLLWWYKK